MEAEKEPRDAAQVEAADQKLRMLVDREDEYQIERELEGGDG
jgi:hypothetical protein